MRILYNGRQKIDKFVLGRMKFILTKINYNLLSQETSQLIVRDIVETLNGICEDRMAFKFNQTCGRQDIPEIFTFLKAKLYVCCQAESWIYDLNV